MGIKYRIASLNDVTNIFLLNKKWGTTTSFKKKYITICFSESEVLVLVQKGNIVVAELENKIIGYYLINDVYETALTKKYKELLNDSISTGKIPNGSYAHHTQAVVDVGYMRQGIGKSMLDFLKRHLSDRYDFLMGSIRKNNLKAKEAHVKSGWIIFYENIDRWVVFTDVSQV